MDKTMILPAGYHGMKHSDSSRNIITGIGSVVDLFGTQSLSQSDELYGEHVWFSDYLALKSDWLAVGNDMSQVMVGSDMPQANKLFILWHKAYHQREVKNR